LIFLTIFPRCPDKEVAEDYDWDQEDEATRYLSGELHLVSGLAASGRIRVIKPDTPSVRNCLSLRPRAFHATRFELENNTQRKGGCLRWTGSLLNQREPS
jgi:hypothetical protein